MQKYNDQDDQAAASKDDGGSSAPELPATLAARMGLSEESDSSDTEVLDEVSPTDEPDSLGKSIDEDPETDKDVDDILASEGDQLLDMQQRVPAVSKLVPKKRGLSRWWHNKWARYLTLGCLLLAVIAPIAVPTSRYRLLNAAGVRSTASVTILDRTTGMPLKNILVTLEGKKAITDRNGVASFNGLRLGQANLTVTHIAFAALTNSIVIGWGNNQLAPLQLRPTGIQYAITVTDYVSGKPLPGVEADTSDATAVADSKGKITLTENSENPALKVTFSQSGYNTLATTLNATNTSSFDIALVPIGKDAFVSEQNGTYNVYSTDLDGSNQKEVLTGTGLEKSNMALVVSPDGTQAALVSTRDNVSDSNGNLLEALTIIDLKQGTSVTIDHDAQIQLIDWIGNQLVYDGLSANPSIATSQRNQLISYNTATNSRIQLATAAQFNAIMSAKGNIYYTMSSSDPNAQLGLYKIKPDGTARQHLSTTEILTGLRTAYNTLALQSATGWSTYDLDNGTFTAAPAPSSALNDEFIDSADGTKSIWTTTVNGKNTLQVLTATSGKSAVLQSVDGLASPYRWASANCIVYRVASQSETADYVTSSSGGSAHKIANVVATSGYAQSN